ncbi:prepilin-type N-terminal cleavage/methylation domain-containing protein [Anaerosporobacter faecicola]|uniref:prepilin-type N-terminal cleavage/methylation domain-containing protein n=1 Tax=Anaerosporobacter faecicola TaxID=2718714 RepID=UPI001EE5988D|nr:prepilin-type N-terminal cleavage/methylation domain-containing protein [Anaerosporobacter faecicola]
MKKMNEMKEQRKKLNNKGFSLVELIVVIAIMAILTVVVAPQFMRYIEKSRKSVDLQTIDSIKSSIQSALADEAAWDSTGSVDVTINFTNSGDFTSVTSAGDRSITGSTRVSATKTDNPNDDGQIPEFNLELNENMNKTVRFKSKEYKSGVTFTINGSTKEIKWEKNADTK